MHVQNMVPNVIGNYETARIPVAWGSGNTVTLATYGITMASDAFQKTDGTARLFACTPKRIIEVTSSGITDRSLGAADYTATTMWHGTQYGDVTIYASYENAPQSSSSGAFAALAGTPPKAKFICAQSLAVALAYYNDGVNVYKDGVWISDIGDQTTWTPASSNQAANFRLLQTPGEITGLKAFKGDILAFKANSLYRISYVGRPIIWQAQLISDNVGAAGSGAICVCDDVVVFGGLMGWYIFDGNNLQQIAPGRNGERATSIVANPANTTQYATGGPTIANYTNGSAFFWAEAGLALFHPTSAQNGGTGANPIVAVQVKDGEGKGAIGQFVYVLSSALAPNDMLCLVRGTSAALVAAGIGTDATYGQSWAAIFALSGSGPDVNPFTMSGTWSVTGGSGYEALVQTSFLGDPRYKTSWNAILPLTCSYKVASTLPSYSDGWARERPDAFGTALQGADFTGTLDNENVWVNFSKTTRFATFQFGWTTAAELEDLVIDSKAAGSK